MCYDARRNRKTGEFKQPPENAVPCQEPDEITGHWPHWVPVTKQDKWHLEVDITGLPDGTYELCGPRIQSNPEGFEEHVLVPHGKEILFECVSENLTFEVLRSYLEKHDIEGIVFHEKNGDRMCKLRKSDFGIQR